MSWRSLQFTGARCRCELPLQKPREIPFLPTSQVNLLTGEGPELPKVTNPESDGLDPEFLRKLKRSAASRDSLVSQGLKHLEDEGDGEDDEKNGEDGEQEQKRMKMAEEEEKKNEKEEDGYDGMDWMGAMSALNALSSGSEDEAGNPSASASASAASSKWVG